MWWLPLALAAGKSVLDNQSNKQNIQSNIIKEKYSPWTGQHGDFSAQGQNSFGSNMLSGAGGALMAYNAEQALADGKQADYLTAQKKDGDFYASNHDLMTGKAGNGIASTGGKSSFANLSRVPAASPVAQVPAAPAPSPKGAQFSDLFPPSVPGQTPLPMQQPQNPADMWSQIAQMKSAPYTPGNTNTLLYGTQGRFR